MLHSLAVNDVFIGAELLDRRYNQVSLVEMEHEWDFKRNPFRGDVGSVAPDGLLRLRIGIESQDVLLEIDRRTVTKAQWLDKIEKHLALAQGPFQEIYETAFAPTVATLAIAGEERRERLRAWTAVMDTEACASSPGWTREISMHRLRQARPYPSPPCVGVSSSQTK